MRLDDASPAAQGRGDTTWIVARPCHHDRTFDHHEGLLGQFLGFFAAPRDWLEDWRQPVHQLGEDLSNAPPDDLA